MPDKTEKITPEEYRATKKRKPEKQGGVGTDMKKTLAVLDEAGRHHVRLNGQTLYQGDDLRAFVAAIEAHVLPLWDAGEIDAAWGDLSAHTMAKPQER